MGKININGVAVELLGNLKLNGHNYVFGLVNNDLNFYEMTRNEFGINYVLPKKDFTLEGNAGGSIRELNGRIFMQHFADELKRDIKLGKLRNLDDISNEISNMQSVFDEVGSDELKTLFKCNVANLDDDSLMSNSEKIYSKLNSKRKAKGKDDFDFIDGGEDKTFSVKKDTLIPKQSAFASSNASSDIITPTVILDKMSVVPKKDIVAEIKSESPSTSAIGLKDSKVSTEVLQDTLDRKGPEMNNIQKLYIEEVIAAREEKEEVKPIVEEKVEKVEPVVEDPTLLLPKIDKPETTKKFDIEEFTKKDMNNRLEDTITSYDDFNKYQESKRKEESNIVPVVPKVSRSAAYVDTVILCLLVQLGIFGLLIFVLLLIK